jgi:hypothetical protein
MSNKPKMPPNLPPAVQRVSSNLKWAGTIGLWTQLVLGVAAGGTLVSTGIPMIRDEEAGLGTQPGILLVTCGLFALGISVYFSFRYARIAQLLKSADPAQRPSRADTLRTIRYGVIVNLVGMLLILVGTLAIIGSLTIESLTQSPGLGVGGASARFILPIDVFLVNSNVIAIAAHFAGIVTSLWLLDRIAR